MVCDNAEREYLREQVRPWISDEDTGFDVRLVMDRMRDELHSIGLLTGSELTAGARLTAAKIKALLPRLEACKDSL
jgi:hypothetical protein